MLDYSKTTKESKSYITSYNFDGKDIVVKYANNDTKRIPYSEESENSIIDTMEYQARFAKAKPLTGMQKFLCFLQPIALPMSLYNTITSNGDKFRVIITAIIAFGAVYYPAKAINYNLKKRDVKKLGFFLENKDELNRCLVNRKFRRKGLDRKIGLTKGVSKKAFKSIEKELEIKRNPDLSKHIPQPININNIESYSLKDLEILKQNAEEMKAKYPEFAGEALTLKMNH